VFDERTGTWWLGDLLFVDRLPALDGSIKGWLQVLQELVRVPAKRVIPGHGRMVNHWVDAITAQQRYLQGLVTTIRALIKQGGTLEQALETVGHEERGNWLLFADYHKRNVSKAFAELEWE
jgi:glyoxylase-like metal-dependent hydrolase (beta-lactamase superfamily II)